jgi:hypothetical protein
MDSAVFIKSHSALRPLPSYQRLAIAIVAGSLGVATVILVVVPLVIAIKLEQRSQTAYLAGSVYYAQNNTGLSCDGVVA